MRRNSLLFAASLMPALTSAVGSAPGEPDWWLVANLNDERIAIHPHTSDRRALADREYTGVVSPDGTRIAYVASDEHSPRDRDLFIADFDAAHPTRRPNPRMLTTSPEHAGPDAPLWTPNSRGVVFLAGKPESLQVWHVDLGESPSEPVRLSDGQHRSFNARISPSGRIAFLTLTKQEKKQRFMDLTIIDRTSRTGDFSDAKRTTLVTGQHVTAMEFSPDGTALAYSTVNELHVHDFATQKTQTIRYDAVHPRLVNHFAWQLSWRPDGKVIAALTGFAGGIAAREGQPPPQMFADGKAFLIPAAWSGAAPKYEPGDQWPSPIAEGQAEANPLPWREDESKPWSVLLPRGRVITLEWIRDDEVPVKNVAPSK